MALEACGHGALFVGAMYLTPGSTRPDFDRNAPAAILHRFAVSGALAAVGVLRLRSLHGSFGAVLATHVTGTAGQPLKDATAAAVKATLKLFSGVVALHVCNFLRSVAASIVARGRRQALILEKRRLNRGERTSSPREDIERRIVGNEFLAGTAQRHLRESAEDTFCLTGLRDYVVAPLAEEITLRCVVLELLYATRDGTSWLSRTVASSAPRRVALSAAIFGACHVHHAVKLYLSRRDHLDRYVPHLPEAHRRMEALKPAVLNGAAHFLVTFVFGVFGGGIYNSSRNILASTAAHGLCNYLGPPTPEHLGKMRGFILPDTPEAGKLPAPVVVLERVAVSLAYIGGVAAFALA